MVDQAQEVMPPGDCILFSTADWYTPYWTNKQHTARWMADKGWRVLYVESVGLRSPSASSRRDWGRLFRRLIRGIRTLIVGPEEVESNLWVLPPLMFPGKHHVPLIRIVNQALLRYTLARFLKNKKSVSPLVWTYHPFMLDAIDGLETGKLAYHCVDDLAAVPGVDAQAFNRQELLLLNRCDAVFTTSEALKSKCMAHNRNTYYHPNVVDFEHFNRALNNIKIPLDLTNIAEPRIVYHGVLSDFKVDFELVNEATRLRPEWQWVFIGEEREGQNNAAVKSLRQRSNVHFMGYKNYDELPQYLAHMVVGLLPTLLNDYTKSMFPMKYYEYLAAGLPVVTTPLDFSQTCHSGLEVGRNVDSFVAGIEKQIKRGKLTAEEATQFVGVNTWGQRMTTMLSILRKSN